MINVEFIDKDENTLARLEMSSIPRIGEDCLVSPSFGVVLSVRWEIFPKYDNREKLIGHTVVARVRVG